MSIYRSWDCSDRNRQMSAFVIDYTYSEGTDADYLPSSDESSVTDSDDERETEAETEMEKLLLDCGFDQPSLLLTTPSAEGHIIVSRAFVELVRRTRATQEDVDDESVFADASREARTWGLPVEVARLLADELRRDPAYTVRWIRDDVVLPETANLVLAPWRRRDTAQWPPYEQNARAHVDECHRHLHHAAFNRLHPFHRIQITRDLLREIETVCHMECLGGLGGEWTRMIAYDGLGAHCSALLNGLGAVDGRENGPLLYRIDPSCHPYLTCLSTVDGVRTRMQKFQELKCHWLPADVQVGGNGDIRLRSHIPGLDTRTHRDLYVTIRHVLRDIIPLFEQCLQTTLRGRDIQVIVNAVDRIFTPGESWTGSWHVDGDEDEKIIATALLCYEKSEHLDDSGWMFRAATSECADRCMSDNEHGHPEGIADFASRFLGTLGDELYGIVENEIFRKADYTAMVYEDASSLVSYDFLLMEGGISLGSVELPEGRVLVFPNYLQQREGFVMNKHASENACLRTLRFMLVDPTMKIPSSGNVGCQNLEEIQDILVWSLRRFMPIELILYISDEERREPADVSLNLVNAFYESHQYSPNMINVALLGAGLFVREAHLPALLEQSAAFHIRAVYSRSTASAAGIAAIIPSKPDVYSEEGGSTPSLDDLLKRDDIHAVVLAMPIGAQPEIIKACLKAGKHVLSEKPIAKDCKTASELVKFYIETQRVTPKLNWSVAENYRFETGVNRAAELVGMGKIGDLVSFSLVSQVRIESDNKYYKTAWRQNPDYDGGFLLDAGVHFVAALRLVLNGRADLKPVVDRVAAFTSLHTPHLAPMDTVDATIKTTTGVSGTFSVSFACGAGTLTRLRVVGSNGAVECSRKMVDGKGVYVVELFGPDSGEAISSETFQSDGIVGELAAFARCVEGKGADFRANVVEAVHDVALMEAMFESGRKEGASVKRIRGWDNAPVFPTRSPAVADACRRARQQLIARGFPIKISGPSAWGKDSNPNPIVELSTVHVCELKDAASHFSATGKPLIALSKNDFRLPSMAKLISDVQGRLLKDGAGFAVLRGLDLDNLSTSTVATIFLGIGSHLGTRVPQNGSGHLLGHVRDMQQDLNDPNTRIYATAEAQRFHTDSCDVVGLLCIHPASEGGSSSVSSSHTIWNEIISRGREDLALCLASDFYWDRKGEGSREPFYKSPVFHVNAHGQLMCRFKGVPELTRDQLDAMDAVESLAVEHSYDMELRRGDMQFVHNHSVLHARSAFRDDGRGPGRHLLRLWLSCGGVGQLGWTIPPPFFERYGPAGADGRRGGVGRVEQEIVPL
ncbi:hypothetical protein HK101_006242 [Irineochytrium annulatum]|nr:hypothetical protein HK101_006242 [Irineochytrium annulatum]